MKTPYEPLELSAPLAWRLAPTLCRLNSATGENCSWLHRFWQCLRLMGLAATPERHFDFYRRGFDGVTGDNGSPRVLVSGAADYSMLAHLLAAFRARGVEPVVTIVEVCDTPLYLNRWYAERMSCRIETVRCSVLEYSVPAAFDAVCTHSFFGQFSRDRRPALPAAWRRLLRPGGMVITANPLRPLGADERNSFTAEQASAFRAVVRSRVETLSGLLQVDPQDILRQAENYTRAQYGYPVRSGKEVLDLFESSGFKVDDLTCGPAASGGQADLGGPGLRAQNVHYACVIARRL
jgi:SAM-dependent methyltransferase